MGCTLPEDCQGREAGETRRRKSSWSSMCQGPEASRCLTCGENRKVTRAHVCYGSPLCGDVREKIEAPGEAEDLDCACTLLTAVLTSSAMPGSPWLSPG